MYAIKQHINKVMAVFLCACLLLSYNPSFGMVGTAEALGSQVPSQGQINGGTSGNGASGISGASGDATTNVNVNTFDGALIAEVSPGFAATVEQINANSQKLIVNAVCGHGSDFTYEWSVSRDGEASVSFTAGISNTFNAASQVSTSEVNLPVLINYLGQNYFTDGHKYTFTCTVKCAGEAKTLSVVVTTVNNSEYEDPSTSQGKRLDHADGTAAIITSETGGFLKGAELKSADMKPADEQGIYGKLFAAEAQKLPKADGAGDYELGRIQVNSIIGDQNTENGGVKPAYSGDLSMMLPLQNVKDENGNDRYSYKAGDQVYVIYQKPGDTTGESMGYVLADVVNDGGQLKAQFKVDDVSGPFMPGYFAVAYAPNKVNTSGGQEPAHSYYISAKVTSGATYGRIDSSAALDRGIWTVGNNPATYSFVANPSKVDGDVVTYYSLSSISFGLKSGNKNVIYQNGNIVKPMVDGLMFQFDANTGTLSIFGGKADAEYDLQAVFTSQSKRVEQIVDPKSYKVYVSLVDENGGTNVGDTSVLLTYFKDEAAQTTATVSGKTPGIGSGNGYSIDALKLTSVRFDVSEAGEQNGKSYYLKEIRTGSSLSNMSQVTPVSNSSYVTGDENCTAIYRQFVIGQRDSTYEPPSTLKATFMLDPATASLGTIDDPDFAGGKIELPFEKGATGTPVILKATSGYYADTVRGVNTDTGEEVYQKLDLGNTRYKQTFPWSNYTNHGNNMTFYVHFSQVPEIQKFKFDMGAAPEHGTVTPAGWDIDPNGYAEGDSLTFTVSPDEGYKLDGDKIYAVLADGTKVEIPVIGGNATLVMPGQAVVGIEASFVEIPESEKPNFPPNEPSRDYALNLYVADSSLTSTNSLGYATGSNVSNNNATDLVIGTGDGKVGLNGYSSNDGFINGVAGRNPISTTVTASNAAGYPSYPISLKANTDREVEKVMVVRYNTASNNKVVVNRTLYYTVQPTFTVEDIQGDTDVVVYFRTCDAENPPVLDPDDTTWVKVDTQLVPATAANATYAGEVEIVKGQGFENKITPVSGKRWQSLFWEGGCEGSMDVNGSATAKTVKLDAVGADTQIYASLQNSTTPVLPSYTLSSSNAKNGTVRAEVGTNWRDLGTWEEVPQTSAVKLTVKANANYRLSDLKIYTDAKAYGFVNANTKTLRFESANVAPSGDGWVAVAPELFAAGIDSTTTEVVWNVENLMSNIAVVPTFEAMGEIPDINPNDYWTIDASIGKGVGTITSPQADNGFPLKVEKAKDGAEAQTVRIAFTPGYTADQRAYEITNVTVKRATDNIFVNAWEFIQGLVGASPAQQLENVIKQGYIELKADANYQITVDFGIAGASTDPNDPDNPPTDNYVAVNVKSDPLKGRVMPASPVLVSKTGSQQFVVDPNMASNNKYYSVAKVVVSYVDNNGQAQTKEYTHTDTDTLLRWDSSYANVFTVNVGSLGLAPTNLNAMTVEVVYSETGDTAGGFGGEGGGSSETPPLEKMKKVSVAVQADGVAVGDTSNTGGVVAPRGTFYLWQQKVEGTNEFTKQLVLVSPAEGYALESITVNGQISDDYMKQVNTNNAGFFYISTEDLTAEEIVVNFTQKPLEERTFTVQAVVADSSKSLGAVVPSRVVTLQPGETFFFNLSPSVTGVAATKITDQYNAGTANNPQWVNVPADNPRSSSWTRTDSDPLVKEGFNVQAVYVDGKVVDRRIVVEFGKVGNDPDADLDGNHERTNIKVSTWGNGRSKMVLSPYCSLMGVAKSKDAQYVWNAYLPASAYQPDSSGGAYRIYCVEQNGRALWGDKTNLKLSDLTGEYSVTFDYDTLTRKNNTLDIYVRYFSAQELAGNIQGSTGSTITGESGPGGDIVQRTTNGTVVVSSRAANGAASSVDNRVDFAVGGAYEEGVDGPGGGDNIGGGDIGGGDEGDDNQTGGDDNNTPTTPGDNDQNVPENPGESGVGGDSGTSVGGSDLNIPVDWYVVPQNGYVIDQVFLHNCKVTNYDWMIPNQVPNGKYVNDTRDKRVALKCSLQLIDSTKSGYVYVTYRALKPGEELVDQDKVFDEDKFTSDDNALNHMVVVEVTPGGAVEELSSGGNILDVLKITKPELWLNQSMSEDGHSLSYNTVDPVKVDKATGNFSFEVGPIIKWNETDNSKSTIYTVDMAAIDGKLKVEAKPDQAAIDKNKADAAEGTRTSAAADGDDAKPAYYAKYVVSGNVKDFNVGADKTLKLTVPLTERNLENGTYPEFQKQDANDPSNPNEPNNPNDPNNPDANVTYTVSAAVNDASWGSLEPVAYDGNKWFEGVTHAADQWTVKSGTYVAFDVKANAGYRLKSLTRTLPSGDSIDCRINEYSATLKRVAFPVTNNTELTAVFDTDANTLVTVTIEVVGGHGSTYPKPGTHQAAMGEDYTIWFDADKGYVVDKVRVTTAAGSTTQSYSAGAQKVTLSGDTLWQNTKVEISYKLAGTSGGDLPDNNNGNGNGNGNTTQVGQNTANNGGGSGSGTGLTQTGDTLWLMAGLLVVAGAAAIAVLMMRRRKAASARAAKYSVTPRRRR